MFSAFFLVIAISLSFIKPIYLFKNNILMIFVPFVFSWSGLILFLILNKIFILNIISIILMIIGCIFAGIIPEVENRKLHYTKLFNYMFTRLFLLMTIAFIIIDIIKYFYKVVLE
jgi:cytochrome c biogenesis protein CcdA